MNDEGGTEGSSLFVRHAQIYSSVSPDQTLLLMHALCRLIVAVEFSACLSIDRCQGNGYLRNGGDMLKRIADWLEKVSVAAFAVGIFHDQLMLGLAVTAAALAASLIITKKIGG